MSKRDLKKYLTELNKTQLEEQVLELYEKFSAVKTYYDFVFNPKEETLLKECKSKFQMNIFPKKIQARREGRRNSNHPSHQQNHQRVTFYRPRNGMEARNRRWIAQ